PLPLSELADGRGALAAGKLRTLVHVELPSEIPRAAISAHVVAQRSATGANRRFQHGADGACQPRRILARQRACPPARPDARAKQRLVRVDVADADDECAVHEELFDGYTATSRDAPEIVTVESRIERLGSEPGEQRVLVRVCGRGEVGPEASRVVEAHDDAGVELDVAVVVRDTREVAWQDPQAPGDPEMHEQRAPFECNQQVLGAPSDIQDALPGH